MVKLGIMTLAIALASVNSQAQAQSQTQVQAEPAKPNCVAMIAIDGQTTILKIESNRELTEIETQTNGENDILEKIKAFIASGLCNPESIKDGKYLYF